MNLVWVSCNDMHRHPREDKHNMIPSLAVVWYAWLNAVCVNKRKLKMKFISRLVSQQMMTMLHLIWNFLPHYLCCYAAGDILL